MRSRLASCSAAAGVALHRTPDASSEMVGKSVQHTVSGWFGAGGGVGKPQARCSRAARPHAVREAIQARPDLFVTAIDAIPSGRGWSGAPVAVSVRASADVVVTGARYEPLSTVQPSPPEQGEER